MKTRLGAPQHRNENASACSRETPVPEVGFLSQLLQVLRCPILLEALAINT